MSMMIEWTGSSQNVKYACTSEFCDVQLVVHLQNEDYYLRESSRKHRCFVDDGI